MSEKENSNAPAAYSTCSTMLNTTKAEELMPETTQVSQASLW